MTKGTYNVREKEEETPRRDASFRSCLCALLIFIAVCCIIAIAGVTWTKREPVQTPHKAEEVEDLGQVYKHYNKKEKLIYAPTTTTRKYITYFHSSGKPILSTTRNTPVTGFRPTEKSTTSTFKTVHVTTRNPIKSTKTLVLSTKNTDLVDKTTTGSWMSNYHTYTTESSSNKLTSTTPNHTAENSTFVSTASTVTRTNTLLDLLTHYTKYVASSKSYLSTPSSKFYFSTVGITTDVDKTTGTSTIDSAAADKENNTLVGKITDTAFVTNSQPVERKYNTQVEKTTQTIFTTNSQTIGAENSSNVDNILQETFTTYSQLVDKYPVTVDREYTTEIDKTTQTISSINPQTVEKENITEVDTIFEKSFTTASLSTDTNAKTMGRIYNTETDKTTQTTFTISEIIDTTKVKKIVDKTFVTNSQPVDENTNYNTSVIYANDVEYTTEANNNLSTAYMSKDTTIFNLKTVLRGHNIQRLTNKTTDLTTTDTAFTTESNYISTKYRAALKENTNDSVTELQETDDITSVVTEKSKIKDNTTTLKTTTKSFPISFDKSEPVCHTSGCKSAASRMLSLMNHSVDACENFYEFSCGGMQADTADSDTWDRLSRQLNNVNSKSPIFLRKFKQFYDSCVNYDDNFNYIARIDAVKKILNMTGNFVEKNATDIDLTTLFAKLILINSMPLMDVGIDLDKTSKYVLQLTLPHRSLASSEIEHWSALLEIQRRCLKEERRKIYEPNLNLTEIHDSYLTCSKNYTSYLNSIESTIQALGVYSQLDKNNATQKIQGLRYVIDIDILGFVSTKGPSTVEARATMLNKDQTTYRVVDLQTQYPLLNWKALFTELTGNPTSDHTIIHIYFGTYFSTLFKHLSSMEKGEINNALLAIYANDLFQNLVIPKQRVNNDVLCKQLSTLMYHDVSSNLYIETRSNASIRKDQDRVNNIFDLLKANFSSAVQNEDWLDDNSKLSVVKKINSLKLYFAQHNEECISEKTLDIKYSTLNITNYYEYNLITLKESRRKILLGLEGKQFNGSDLFCYFASPYDKIPFSFYGNQLIAVPYGIVEDVETSLPGYLQMAKIGIHLARGIGYNFDSVGIKHNMVLSQSVQPIYNKLTEDRFFFTTTRYNNYQALTFKIDGSLSNNEKIVDSTALKLTAESYDSLEKNYLLPWILKTYTKSNIFYIAVAQEYCERLTTLEYMLQLYESEFLPASLRIENMMINSDDFSQSFNCKPGSKMNDIYQKMQFPHLPSDLTYGDEYDSYSDISER